MIDRKVVFITGASSGIGYETALEFARRGYAVVGTARREGRLAALAQEVEAISGSEQNFLAIPCDVQDRAAVQAVVDQMLSRWGRVDVLVANAGVGHRGSLVDAEWSDLKTVMRTNMDGVIHSIRAVVPAMRHNNGGHIIVISSVTYNLTAPYAAMYAATKAFVSSIAHSLRLELKKDNIYVTDMVVGRTESEFNQKRLGKAGRTGGGIPVMPTEKVARAIVDTVGKDRRSVTLRWLDRLTTLANVLVPDIIGRLALRQYK
jgi:short-subunit dehydrogenase